MIWQMMVAMLHSNGQSRTERDGDTQKGCQEPALQQKTTDVNTRNHRKITAQMPISSIILLQQPPQTLT